MERKSRGPCFLPTPLWCCRSLELENVRCLGERQTLELTDEKDRPAQWALLLGDNGVGKTTLLQCLAWMRPVPAGVQNGDGPRYIGLALVNEENRVLDSLLRAGDEVSLNLKASIQYQPAIRTGSTGSRTPRRHANGGIADASFSIPRDIPVCEAGGNVPSQLQRAVNSSSAGRPWSSCLTLFAIVLGFSSQPSSERTS